MYIKQILPLSPQINTLLKTLMSIYMKLVKLVLILGFGMVIICLIILESYHKTLELKRSCDLIK